MAKTATSEAKKPETKAKTSSKASSKAAKPAAKKLPQKKVKHHHVPRGAHGGVQLLLIEDVLHLGKAGEVVEVKPGYARNYLLPRGLATFVTPHNMRRLDLHKIKVQKMREAKMADLKALAEQLSRVAVTISSLATPDNHLYGSVGPAEIADALKKQNFKLDPEVIKLEGVIKELGLYEVKIQLANEIETMIKVLVIGQAQELPKK